MAELMDGIVEQLHTLPEADLHTIRDFIAFLSWKREPQSKFDPALSAEARAIERLKDVDNPEMWVTTVQEGDEINVLAYERLRQSGYSIQIPSENPSTPL
jgi:hypothetical protein